MKKLTCSTLQWIILALSLLVLATSLYLQYVKGYSPCPLCLMQRLCVIIIVVLGVINLLLKPPGKKMLIAQSIIALLGIYFAARQLWLLSLPAQEVPACLPGLSVLIHYFPWKDTAHALLWGTGDCTENKWTLLGLTMPAWSMFYFILVSVLGGLSLTTRPEKNKKKR